MHTSGVRLGGQGTNMLSTKALLNPFHSIFSKVHHPPPLDNRESQRLLKALTTSFRKNLDKEHGYLSQDPATAASYNLKTPSDTPSTTAPHESHRRPTDRHVRAILSNPLFSYAPSKTVSSSPSTERDPMDVFDQAVAKGLMNPKRAAGVLIAKRQAIAQSSSISVPEGMANSGTAHRVVSWLRSSGLERNLSFVKHQPLLKNLIPFMVEEGLDEVVWAWLEQWMATEVHAVTMAGYARRASPLLTALVRAKISPGSSLDAGYATLIRADDMFSNHQAFSSTALAPWRTLSVMSTVFAWQRSPPSEVLFDSFAAMSERLREFSSTMIDRAHLDLYHPTHPDAAAALNFLKSPMLDRLGARLDRADEIPSGKTFPTFFRDPKSIAKSVVLMATDTAQHLTRIGDEAQAEWVGDLLLAKLGKFLRTELVSAAPDLHLLQPAPATG
ncbi:hypothetical protein N0V93_009827 [Gnomoniopsis smithogilvyi]|uniref:Uncharacterized protein n=1 Tax=Gnomoniopsis smithogilvyi TaxID=1191159 RepID=A0A9W8YII9_9PEZI|nr:hypothetical protein N0V93_009827 [Gnomoniopsis smithogilvyi]